MLKRSLNNIKLNNGKYHDENQYLYLIKDIIEHGTNEIGRNGNIRSVFGSAMHFSLENNKIPFITTKKLSWKTCIKELLWFIRGETNNKILQDQNVKIWNKNSSREYLDSRGLFERKENDLGPIYGHQWRFFNANYNNCNYDYTGEGVDQLQNIIDKLKNKNEKYSRRLVLSSWNPCQLDEMALPPCHILVQFNVFDENKLSCSLYQRSGDVGLGVPFNIASYSMFTCILAKHCQLVPYEFCYYLGNAHIYDDHIEHLKEQVLREPYEFPKLNILNKKDNINDYNMNDFIIEDYKYHKTIHMNMRA